MYHSINDDPVGEPDISLKTEDFNLQMKYLAFIRFTSIGFDDLKEAGKYKNPIIFDDGYEDNYKNAYPILKKYTHMGQRKSVSIELNPEFWDAHYER